LFIGSVFSLQQQLNGSSTLSLSNGSSKNSDYGEQNISPPPGFDLVVGQHIASPSTDEQTNLNSISASEIVVNVSVSIFKL
jgi:hypothetical protein